MRGARFAVGVVVVLLAAAPAASADEAKARKAMARGVDALAAGKPTEALVEFHAAQNLVPGAPVPYRYAGKAQEALKLWADAVTSYETYLRIRPTSKDAPEIRKRILDIKRKHLEGVVDVLCTPSGAAVFVDGASATAGVTPLRGLTLAKGPHKLTLRAPGYVDRNLDVKVVPGTTVQMQCELNKIAPPPAPVKPKPVVTKPPPVVVEPPLASRDSGKARPWYKRRWVWAAAGTALLVGGASYYFTRPDLPSTVGGDVHFP